MSRFPSFLALALGVATLWTAIPAGGDSIDSQNPRIKNANLDQVEKELKKSTAVTITYTMELPVLDQKTFTISNPKDVQTLLQTIKVTDVVLNRNAGLIPCGWVDFTQPDGSLIKTFFIAKDILDRDHWGQIELTQSFFEKVCELASKHAGRPIDVLEENG